MSPAKHAKTRKFWLNAYITYHDKEKRGNMNAYMETPAGAARGKGGPAPKTGAQRLLDVKCWRLTVYPSEGLVWNGWVKRWWTRREAEDFGVEIDREIDGENVIVKEADSFMAGIMWDAWLHLIQCDDCRRLNGVTLEEARAAVREIREEWEAYVGANPEAE
jgi:hypothetical protein